MFTKEYANLGLPQLGDGGIGLRGRPSPPVTLVPEIPGTLNELIMACLEPHADRRPAGALEVKQKLVAVARHLRLKSEDIKGCDEE
jgi:hypothetical protein